MQLQVKTLLNHTHRLKGFVYTDVRLVKLSNKRDVKIEATVKERRGSIVNVASVAGIAGSGSSIPYAASKGAVITLTRSLARAFAPEVRVNAVAPGPVQTRWLADHQDMVEQAMMLTPLKRPASPDDIAEAILYLADRATLTTGQVLVIDGGRTM